MMDKISLAIDDAKSRLPSLMNRLEEPMRKHTSFRIGGPVRAMFFPKSAVEMMELYKVLHEYEIEPLIMGNGTNLLVEDKPLEKIVIKTTNLDTIEHTGEAEITAGAGALLSKLAVYAYEYELSGLEFAHGIPGSLGGAVTMNAGAYGGEMKDIVHTTIAYNILTEKISVADEEHGFSYRRSRFSDTGDIVLNSVISLKKADKDSIKARMDELGSRRRESQPLDLPSAGSTFKRPREGYAAALIEQAGLKGYTVGGAQVSEKHSGFVINRGGATFSDVLAVIEHVQKEVFKQFKIELELEVRKVNNEQRTVNG